MSFDPLSLHKPVLPPNRFAVRRAALLEEIERGDLGSRPPWSARAAARAPRRSLALVIAVILLLGAVGTAVGVGVGIDFLAEQKRVDRQPWAAPEMGAVGGRAEVTRGPDWSFMVWKAEDGLCVAYAAGTATNWARSCGRPPDRADADPFTSSYLIALLATPSQADGAADGRGAFVGAVTSEVARVELELADDEVLSAPTVRAPAALDTAARLFILRTPNSSPGSPGSGLGIRTLTSYAANGTRLERFRMR